MRTLFTGGAVVALVLMLAACGGSNGSSSAEKQAEREADVYAISQIERTFHEAISKKNIDQMVEPVGTECDGHVRPWARR